MSMQGIGRACKESDEHARGCISHLLWLYCFVRHIVVIFAIGQNVDALPVHESTDVFGAWRRREMHIDVFRSKNKHMCDSDKVSFFCRCLWRMYASSAQHSYIN